MAQHGRTGEQLAAYQSRRLAAQKRGNRGNKSATKRAEIRLERFGKKDPAAPPASIDGRKS